MAKRGFEATKDVRKGGVYWYWFLSNHGKKDGRRNVCRGCRPRCGGEHVTMMSNHQRAPSTAPSDRGGCRARNERHRARCRRPIFRIFAPFDTAGQWQPRWRVPAF
jgi:hypothetical protein